MRVNEPVTNNEIELPDADLLVSRTDKNGRITFVNHAFAKVSGFTEQELIGSPHNIVRHPHMPTEAFGDLWRTVKGGRPWEGFVKNRTKDGDYYWVRANVTPVMENGRIDGYISIRFKASQEQRQNFDAAYAQFREGRAKGLRIEDGGIVHTGRLHHLGKILGSITGRLICAFGATALSLILVGLLGALGAGSAAIAACVGVGILIVAFLGTQVWANIRAPLKRFERHIDAIARQDFTHDIAPERAKEFHELIILLRAVKAKLAYAEQERHEQDRKAQIRRQTQREMAEHIENDSKAVHLATQEISSAVEDQAATASEMSTSVAEITSTMEELSSSSAQVAEHSQAVVTLADKTWENSKAGIDAMQTMLARMEEIRDDNQHSLRVVEELGRKSKEISKIMQIIESVADQTKLIAFNAALEASSAGEAGKRFSVVASEIRRLADNVTDSAGEIAEKVGEIQDAISNLVVTAEKGADHIDTGMEESGRVAGMLSELEAAAHDSSTAAQQISLATQQQRTASGQVVVALREIVGASSQTTESILRISDVARNLTTLSNQLEMLVSRYQLRSPDRAES